jgi:hypothetical protein
MALNIWVCQNWSSDKYLAIGIKVKLTRLAESLIFINEAARLKTGSLLLCEIITVILMNQRIVPGPISDIALICCNKLSLYINFSIRILSIAGGSFRKLSMLRETIFT